MPAAHLGYTRYIGNVPKVVGGGYVYCARRLFALFYGALTVTCAYLAGHYVGKVAAVKPYGLYTEHNRSGEKGPVCVSADENRRLSSVEACLYHGEHEHGANAKRRALG